MKLGKLTATKLKRCLNVLFFLRTFVDFCHDCFIDILPNIFVWYPAPLDQALGITKLTVMLLGIDIVISPLVGWLVYKEGKKS